MNSLVDGRDGTEGMERVVVVIVDSFIVLKKGKLIQFVCRYDNIK